MEWKYTSSRTKKFKSVPSTSEVMLTLFWDFNWPILEHYQDCGQMVSSAWYYALLEEDLKPVVQSKCRGMLTNRILHHDNS
jgi:hypothetical protein